MPEQHEEIQQVLDSLEIDILSLAGFMKLGYGFHGHPSENEGRLGKILEQVLQLKALLGVPTNLKKVE